VLGRVEHGGKVPADVLDKVRDRVADADKRATDPALRQSLLPAIADVLVEAGDAPGAIRLLQANLASAEAPAYYLRSIGQYEEQLGTRRRRSTGRAARRWQARASTRGCAGRWNMPTPRCA
jgi:predicted Zn-dependent protease